MPAKQWTTRKTSFLIPRRRDDVVLDELDTEASLFDPRSGDTYHLNQTARAVWTRCDGSCTARQVAREMTKAYEVTWHVALDHVEQLVSMFASSGLLEATES